MSTTTICDACCDEIEEGMAYTCSICGGTVCPDCLEQIDGRDYCFECATPVDPPK